MSKYVNTVILWITCIIFASIVVDTYMKFNQSLREQREINALMSNYLHLLINR